jgi:hypothetical protein
VITSIVRERDCLFLSLKQLPAAIYLLDYKKKVYSTNGLARYYTSQKIRAKLPNIPGNISYLENLSLLKRLQAAETVQKPK